MPDGMAKGLPGSCPRGLQSGVHVCAWAGPGRPLLPVEGTRGGDLKQLQAIRGNGGQAQRSALAHLGTGRRLVPALKSWRGRGAVGERAEGTWGRAAVGRGALSPAQEVASAPLSGVPVGGRWLWGWRGRRRTEPCGHGLLAPWRRRAPGRPPLVPGRRLGPSSFPESWVLPESPQNRALTAVQRASWSFVCSGGGVGGAELPPGLNSALRSA